MLPNEVTCDSKTMSLSSLVDNRSIRQWLDDSNLATPETLTVSHNSSGKGPQAVDSYLIRIDKTVATEVDASDNVVKTATMSAYLVVKVPRGYLQSASNANALGTALCTFATTAVTGSTVKVLQRVLKGEL